MNLAENIYHNMWTCISGQGYILGQGHFLGPTYTINVNAYMHKERGIHIKHV